MMNNYFSSENQAFKSEPQLSRLFNYSDNQNDGYHAAPKLKQTVNSARRESRIVLVEKI